MCVLVTSTMCHVMPCCPVCNLPCYTCSLASYTFSYLCVKFDAIQLRLNALFVLNNKTKRARTYSNGKGAEGTCSAQVSVGQAYDVYNVHARALAVYVCMLSETWNMISLLRDRTYLPKFE